ncbi:MAG: response regulator [Acidimicrobiia bacterium]
MERLRSHAPSTSILLADDDERFRTLVRRILVDDGYEVVAEAGCAIDAVRLARAHRPQVAILDLVMPEITVHTDEGEDVVLDLVRSQDAGMRAAQELLSTGLVEGIVILSSVFDPVVEREAAELGIWYLEKAEGIDALEHAIDGAVAVVNRAH